MTEHEHTNRLINETSPYLLQHAHNPVDWFPWGEEAFEISRRDQKPVLLSIGYSACHWCHVMEHESFENEEIAKLKDFPALEGLLTMGPKGDMQKGVYVIEAQGGAWKLVEVVR